MSNDTDPDVNSTGAIEVGTRTRVETRDSFATRTDTRESLPVVYRRATLALVFIGIIAAIGGVLIAAQRELLFVLSSIGLFGGVLLYALGQERFVSAEICELIYGPLATNHLTIATQLNLDDDHHYVPIDDGSARLHIPSGENNSLSAEELDDPAAIGLRSGNRGLVLVPTGAGLFTAFERSFDGELASDPETLAIQLADALRQEFELIEETEVAVGDDQISIGVSGSAIGDVDRFDHPIASFIGVGFAVGLDQPVYVTTAPGTKRIDWRISCRLDSAQVNSP